MSTTMPTRDLDRLSRSGLSTADLENLDDDLMGRAVYDSTAQQVGTVDDLLVDTVQLRAPFLVVSWGGVLGIGKQQRLIPIEAVDRVTPAGIYLKGDKEQVTAGPAYRDDLSGSEAEAFYADVYENYRIRPSSQAGQPLP